MRSLLLIASMLIADQNPALARSPNIVLIFADDLGYGDLGCYGRKDIPTPHLDRLAQEGRRFTSFYVAQAVCSASRAALMTGCYPNRVSIQGALGPAAKHGLHSNEITIAELVKTSQSASQEGGYATAIYGKWHLGHLPRFLPGKQGFDDYLGLPYSNDMWPKHPTARNFPPLPLIDEAETIETNPDQSQLTTRYTEQALAFIEKNRERPFFLYMPHTMPHVPLFVSEKHAGKSEQGLFGDVVAEIDWSVGQILESLKRFNLEENTLVIFTSDNGPWLSYGDHAGSAGDLREGKGTTFEGGVRVPMIARWPGKIPAGSVCHEMAATIDLFPTIAAITHSKLPNHPIDGIDISPLLFDKGPVRTEYFFYWGHELQAVRSGPWKLHFPHEYRSLKEAGKKGTPGPYEIKKTGIELYHLEQDPGEKMDLAEREPEVVARLSLLAVQIRKDLGDSLTKQIGTGIRPSGE